jgi:transcriptional regulator GlxA family with amidase domain
MKAGRASDARLARRIAAMFGRKQQIAIVLYPGVTALDVVGSMEALVWLNVNSPYRLVTVAADTTPVRTDTPLTLVPNRRFDEVPAPFGLLIPGGNDAAIAAGQDATLREYVRSAGERAELVASIGTGSLILADAGLLRGRQATTHWAYADQLAARGARYVRRRRVEDGKFVTAAGSTAGIDLALYLVGTLTSPAKARNAQLIIASAPPPPFRGIDWARVEREPAALDPTTDASSRLAGQPASTLIEERV